MKTFSTRFNLSKFAAPTFVAFFIVTLTTVNGCSQSDRSTDAREEVITQNALEAEAAEAGMASKKEPVKTAAAKPSEKAGHGEKAAHAEKTAKVAKADGEKKPSKEKKGAHHQDTKVASAHDDHAAHSNSESSHGARKPAAAGGTYVVQVGAFKVKENAEKLKEKLHQAGYAVEMQTLDHSRNGTLHLLRFQPTANRAEAETLLEDLSAKQDLHAQIISTSKAAN